MNPVYTILESPHRWLILAGLSFGAGSVGAIMMLAFVWPHTLARIWFYAGLVLAVFFLIRALLDWKSQVESELEPSRPRQGVRGAGARRPGK